MATAQLQLTGSAEEELKASVQEVRCKDTLPYKLCSLYFHVLQVINCALPSWYEHFKDVTMPR